VLVPGAEVDACVGLVEMPEGDSSPSGKMAMATGSGSARTMEGPVGSTLAILESELGGSCVANEDLWEVEAVGSPRVRAMT